MNVFKEKPLTTREKRMVKKMFKANKKLSLRQKEILKLRRNRYSMPDIAKRYKVTRQTIYAILKTIQGKGYDVSTKRGGAGFNMPDRIDKTA